MKECIAYSTVHPVVDSTVRFAVAPAKLTHYISMAHHPCGAWGGYKCVTTVASFDTYLHCLHLRFIDKLGYEVIKNGLFTFVHLSNNMIHFTYLS